MPERSPIRCAIALLAAGAALGVLAGAGAGAATPAASPRNVLIYVADGLRPGSVTAEDAPALYALRTHGTSFPNSHALFPTFTTPNAAALATGHYLGDTGDFGNSLYAGYRLFEHGEFGRHIAGSTPFIENDLVLADLDGHYGGNFLGEYSLLELARALGYSTAAIGKLGPVAIQDVGELAPRKGEFAVPRTIVVDDATGSEAPPLGLELELAFDSAGLSHAAPPRLQSAGDSRTPGTHVANWAQQSWFLDVATKVVLPLFGQRQAPFALVYWSRDPDGTQHNQGDSLNTLAPGINGPTSRAAVRHADEELRTLLEYLRTHADLARRTDVIVVSDHGHATISKRDLDAQGHATTSPAALAHYPDVPEGFLPPGFLALDLAALLHEPLFDPDNQYQAVAPGAHPRAGNAVIGGNGGASGVDDADVIVAANGGSDLLYLPHAQGPQVRHVLELLAGLDYVGALFVDDRFGPLPGALPLSSIALQGGARLPVPAIVVSFRSFLPDMAGGLGDDPLQHAVLVADTPLQQGQGMHGGFGRDNTFNFMAALGPDFRAGFQDMLPVSTADVAPTLERLLKLRPRPRGQLVGRVLEEALRTGRPAAGLAQHCVAVSAPAADGRVTVLDYQRFEGRLYPDSAQLRPGSPGDRSACP
ncbi:MAG TPA: alkaline phosphatase family protein [Steroidobacteraceae bacterium]|nr:alkaline phosphatase family protein [Steroidobacteraceae bacterium]